MLPAAVHGVTNNILNFVQNYQFKVQSQINVIKECEQVKIINETWITVVHFAGSR